MGSSGSFLLTADALLHLPRVESGLELISWAASLGWNQALLPAPLPACVAGLARLDSSELALPSFELFCFIQMNESILLKTGLGPSPSVEDLLPVHFAVPKAKQNSKEPQHLSPIPATAKPLSWCLPPGGP